VHGAEGLALAEKTTAVLYRQDIATLARLSAEEAGQVFQGSDYLRRLFQPGITVLDFAVKIGCFKSERDAMRIIGAGGFYINTVRVTNIEEVLTHGKHIMANSLTVVRVGKKNHYIVEWT
jgi:tyrosyl-tRNA synthetase